MKSLIERHQIKEGATFAIGKNIRSGVTKTGLPFWKFPVAMTEEINGQLEPYSYVWLRSTGMCPYAQGDLVVVKRIKAFTAPITRNHAGGKTIFTTLEVEFEKREKEKTNE